MKRAAVAARALGLTLQPWEVRVRAISTGFLLRWARSVRMDSTRTPRGR